MLIVDAYNVLHVTGVLPPDLAGPDLDDLARMVGESRYGAQRAVLVCDGAGPSRLRLWRSERGAGGVEVRYAGAGREADALIESLLGEPAAGGARRRLLVVSTDGRLRRAAKRARASWLSSEAFLAHLASDAQRLPAAPTARPAFAQEIPLDGPSVAHWLRVLGITDDDPILRLAAAPEPPRPAGGASSSAPPGVPTAHRTPSAAREDAAEPVDPLLLEALKEWAGRLSLDDLDMRRWLGD